MTLYKTLFDIGAFYLTFDLSSTRFLIGRQIMRYFFFVCQVLLDSEFNCCICCDSYRWIPLIFNQGRNYVFLIGLVVIIFLF